MKKMPLYKQIETRRPVATLSICNTFGAAIWNLDGDTCIAAWAGMNGYHTARRHQINYTLSGRPYIRKGSLRLYLDEFMRVA